MSGTSARQPVVVGIGAATGVGVVIRGSNQVRMNWQFPNIGVQMVLTLAIIFTGLLPGLLAFLFVWLSVKDDVKRIEGEVFDQINEPTGRITGSLLDDEEQSVTRKR